MDETCRVWKPARGGSLLLVFVVIFALFPVAGVYTIFTGHAGGGIAAVVVGFGLWLLILFQYAAVGFRYGISGSKIIMKNLNSSETIDASAVAFCTLMRAEELASFLSAYYKPVVESEINQDPGQWFKAMRRYGGITRFMSVQPVAAQAGRGPAISSYKLSSGSSAVLLVLADGRALLLTPADAESFCAALRRTGLRYVAPADVQNEYIIEPFEPEPGGDRRVFWRKLRLTLFVISLAVAAGIVIYINLSNPASAATADRTVRAAEAQSGDMPEPEGAAVLSAGEWLDEDSFRFVMGVETAADNDPDMAKGELVSWTGRYALEAMVHNYFPEDIGTAFAFRSSSAAEDLKDFLFMHSRTRFEGVTSSGDGREFAVFVLSGTGIRQYIIQEFGRFSKRL